MRRTAIAALAIVFIGACRRGSAPTDTEVIAKPAPEGDAGPKDTPVHGLCHAGWCFEDPLPTGEDLVDVVASGPGDVVMATAGGRKIGSSLVRWDGKRFSSSDVFEHVTALYRAEGGQFFAATREGAVIRGDGRTWTSLDVGVKTELASIWGSAADSVWAVGEEGTIVHFDGAKWSRQASPVKARLRVVRGLAPNDVWAAGDGVILHFDGAAWRVSEHVVPGKREQPIPKGGFCGNPAMAAREHNDALTRVAGIAVLGAGDVIATAGAGRVLRFDGTRWNETDLSDRGLHAISSLVALSPTDVYAVGGNAIGHFDGTTWTVDKRDISENFSGVARLDANNVFIVGVVGTMLRGNATKFERVGGRGARAHVSAAHVGTKDVFAIGGDLILRRKPTGDWFRQAETTTEKHLTGIGGLGDNDIWTFEFYGPALHWDGKAWSETEGVKYGAHRVQMTAHDDVWAFGAGEVSHYDGKSWTAVTAPYSLLEIWAPARNVAWATARPRDAKGQPMFGAPQLLVRWDGKSWTKVATFGDNVGGIGGVGTDVWIAGTYDVYRYNGSGLETAYIAPSHDGYPGDRSVVVRSASDVTVGGHGRAVHFDGKSWTEIDPPLASATLAGGAAGLFAFGSSGGIVRRD